MFKKNLTLVLVLSFILFSCDELGIDSLIEITVPASASYTFDMSAETINANTDNSASISRNVDIADLVDENADKIDRSKLKKMTFQVTGYNAASSDLSASFTIQTRKNGTLVNVVELGGIQVTNTNEVLLFQDGQATNLISEAVVLGLESLMDDLEPFDLIVTGALSGNAESDFKITVAWDLDITVAQ